MPFESSRTPWHGRQGGGEGEGKEGEAKKNVATGGGDLPSEQLCLSSEQAILHSPLLKSMTSDQNYRIRDSWRLRELSCSLRIQGRG